MLNITTFCKIFAFDHGVVCVRVEHAGSVESSAAPPTPSGKSLNNADTDEESLDAHVTLDRGSISSRQGAVLFTELAAKCCKCLMSLFVMLLSGLSIAEGASEAEHDEEYDIDSPVDKSALLSSAKRRQSQLMAAKTIGQQLLATNFKGQVFNRVFFVPALFAAVHLLRINFYVVIESICDCVVCWWFDMNA